MKTSPFLGQPMQNKQGSQRATARNTKSLLNRQQDTPSFNTRLGDFLGPTGGGSNKCTKMACPGKWNQRLKPAVCPGSLILSHQQFWESFGHQMPGVKTPRDPSGGQRLLPCHLRFPAYALGEMEGAEEMKARRETKTEGEMKGK